MKRRGRAGVKRPPIGLGDLLLAVDLLGADSAENRKVVSLLLSGGRPSVLPERRAPGPRPVPAGIERSTDELVDRTPTPPIAPESPGEEDEGASFPGAGWTGNALALGHLPKDTAKGVGAGPARRALPMKSTVRAAAPALKPLLRPAWTRGVLAGALATGGESDRIDVARLVDQLARRRLLRRLPTKPAPTLRRGVQVLVDDGEAMMPFREDQSQLLPLVQNVASEGLTKIWYFGGDPFSVYSAGSLEPELYRPPPPGTPVLLLSDLGIRAAELRGAAAHRPYIRLATTLKRNGCPVVALVPHPPHRWPPAMLSLMTFLSWDRRTNAAAVSRRFRAAGRTSIA